MKRHIVQYKARSGRWEDAFDIDQSACVYDTYDEARAFQEWAEQNSTLDGIRVVTLTCDLPDDAD